MRAETRIGRASLLACASFFGCTGSGESDASVDDVNASDVRVLGAIQPGETTTFQYGSTPAFRAYAFEARAGDTVEFSASSTGFGSPRAYVLDATYRIIAKNDGVGGSTKAHIATTLTAAGTHYLAIRDERRLAGGFEVSFSKTGGIVPVCIGKPQFPVRMPFWGKSIDARRFTRSCSGGTCSAWTVESADVLRGSTTDGRTSVNADSGQGPTAHLEFGVDLYKTSGGNGQHYVCDVAERGPDGPIRLDAAGRGEGRLQWRDACWQQSGDGTPAELGPPRAVHVSYGSACMSVVEHEPSFPAGDAKQELRAYVVNF